MISRSLPKNLNAPKLTSCILDTKNAHILTPVKTRTRVARRVSSPVVISDALGSASVHRTFKGPNHRYLDERNTSLINSRHASNVNKSPKSSRSNPTVTTYTSSVVQSPVRPPGSSCPSGYTPPRRPPPFNMTPQERLEVSHDPRQYHSRKNRSYIEKCHTRKAVNNSATQPRASTSASVSATSTSAQMYGFTNLESEGRRLRLNLGDEAGVKLVKFTEKLQRMGEGPTHYSGGHKGKVPLKGVGVSKKKSGTSVVGAATVSTIPQTSFSKRRDLVHSESHTSKTNGPPGRSIVNTVVTFPPPPETRDVEYCWENRVMPTHHKTHLIREEVRKRVEVWIRKEFGSSYTVEFFGSLRYDVSYLTSDLDMVILDSKWPCGYEAPDLQSKVSIYNVNRLANVLRRARFVDVSTRPWASVPIVKFRDPQSNLECDININDRLGVVNSDMLKRYCEMAPILRPLLYEIKEWAKPLWLNSPTGEKGRSGSFSSYAFALMTVGFLQDKYGLPSLQQHLPEVPLKHSGSKYSGVPMERNRDQLPFIVFTKKPHQGWDTRYHEEGVPWVMPFTRHVRAVMKEWARYWTKFPHDTHAIDIRTGGVVERSDNTMGAICVMDPFITTKNVAGGVSKGVLDYFIEECEKAAS